MIPPQDCPNTFALNTLGLCRVYCEKKCWTYGGQLHAWLACLIRIMCLGMEHEKKSCEDLY